ncbi:MAG: hypothetical protein CM15mP12_7100 [Gammaproteobacteria bacterium]|nr:MAG: hypothetical protein CM15mP12_7100 [Gammaproteobacteria bacterium]
MYSNSFCCFVKRHQSKSSYDRRNYTCRKSFKIGGLKEKLIAAKRSGITNVLIPKENLGDIEEIEANVLKNLNITPVENINEVLKEALI